METFDVVIAGGGPGGSAAGTFLARAGLRALILEKDQHPRFRIGESLLPHGNDLLREMGVWEKIEASGHFMPKHGAEFCTGDGERTYRFSFTRGLGPRYASTYQVERAPFDALLLDHAAECGCDVRQKSTVTHLAPDDAGVTVRYEHADGPREVRASWFVDATGRDAVAGRLLAIAKHATLSVKRVATYAHFRGVTRNEGLEAGNITIVRLAAGWFWIIPLTDDKTSVGYVRPLADFKTAGFSPADGFQAAVQAHSDLAARFQAAERIGEFHTTGDYSYRFETFAPHPRVLLAGDAAGFVDPIFSSGVMMALKSARLAARTIVAQRSRPLAPRQRERYTRDVRRMMDLYVRMINAFYDRASFEILMDPQPILQIPSSVAAVVGGRTELPFRLRWRLAGFYLLCRLQRWLPLAPRIPLLAGEPAVSASRP